MTIQFLIRGDWVNALVARSIRAPRATLVVWSLILLLSLVGLGRIHFDTTTDSVLDRRAREWSQYQRSIKLFGGDEIVVVAISSPRSFDPHALEEVRELTHRLEAIRGVRRVDSLASVPLVEAQVDGSLSLNPALDSSVPVSASERSELGKRVFADRLARRNLVSTDGKTFAINVLLDADVGGEFERIVREIRADAPADSWVSGVPVFRTAANERTRSEILILAPFTMLLMAGLLYWVFGSPSAVGVPLVASGLGSVVTLAAHGYTGTDVTAASMILPSILLALGCAYIMHILFAVRGLRSTAEQLSAIQHVAKPVALSGLTTALGFLAISTVRIEAAQTLGAFGGLGVLAVLAASLTAAPALLAIFPVDRGQERVHEWIQNNLREKVMGLVSSRPGMVTSVWAVALLVLGSGLVTIPVSTDLTKWFPPNSEVRRSYEEIREHLSGISPMNVVIEATADRPVTDPSALNAIAGLTSMLDHRPEVGRALSFVDPLLQLHHGFAGDESAGLPRDGDLIEQYLLLLDGMVGLDDLLTDDRRAANVPIRADENGSQDLLRIARDAEQWWTQNGPPGYRVFATGIMFEFARAEEAISTGQLQGLGLAFLSIGLILVAIFRSVPLAGAALVPNVVPLIAVFGFMGLVGIPLDIGNIALGSLALGIAVDDTIHILVNFREERTIGQTTYQALNETMRRVLPPVVYTSVAIGLGFGVLGISQFTVTRNLGLVTAGMVVCCLLADVILLPSLFFLRGKRNSQLKTGA